MKIVMEFDSENFEDMELHKIMLKANAAHAVIHEIRQQLFRPARKHGYDDPELNKLIDDSGMTQDGYTRGSMIVEALEKRFGEILEEYDVKEDGDY
jgi:hypothetical protein